MGHGTAPAAKVEKNRPILVRVRRIGIASNLLIRAQLEVGSTICVTDYFEAEIVPENVQNHLRKHIQHSYSFFCFFAVIQARGLVRAFEKGS